MMKEKGGKKGNEWREKLERKEDKKVRKDGRELRKEKKRSGGKKILLLTKCKGHSLMQRWDGKICTKGSKFCMSF